MDFKVNYALFYAQEALRAQDYCYVSDVAAALAEFTIALRVANPDKSRDWYNHHPIAIIYSTKIKSLTSGYNIEIASDANYGRAIKWCERVAHENNQYSWEYDPHGLEAF